MTQADGIGEEKKLNKNVSDCLARVKSASSDDDKDQVLENFKMKTTLVFLLCSPSVRDVEKIQNSKDYQSVLRTFPTLKDSSFFSIVRNQKFYKYLEPLLSCLPPSTLCKLMQEYFNCTNEVTPLTLAITMELMKALVSSMQNVSVKEDYSSESKAVFSSILNFFSLKKVVGGTNNQVKSSAYFFMYLCECTFFMLSTVLRKNEPQKLSIVPEAWIKLWKSGDSRSNLVSDKGTFSMDILKSFFDMCNENIKGISVDMWIEWNEVMLPLSVTIHRKSVASKIKPEPSTIQSVICNIAFDMLRIVESCSDSKELLHSYKDLTQFFQQVASDPDYDPDYDLPVEKLLSEVELKDGRQEKLLDILMKKDDIFTSEKCIDCVMTYGKNVDNVTKLQVLTRLIKLIKEKREYDEKSVEMVLKMVEDLPATQLLPLIEKHLSSGQDEILKTPDFNVQMTSVFNQLADDISNKNSTKHVWLCLQSGQSVVSEAVRLPVAFPGLVNVMVQALAVIHPVCQAKGKSGASILISILQDRLVAGLQGREEKDFGELVKGLLAANIINATEVMHFLVQPQLELSPRDMKRLELPLELLMSVIHHDVRAVVKPGVELVSLMMMMAHIINATAYLDSLTSNDSLKLRAYALEIMQSMSQIMVNDRKSFERDISMIKQTIVKYKFHPRSFIPLLELLGCKHQFTGHADCLLLMISKLKGRSKVDDATDFADIFKASIEELIMALIQLLPHCSEEEWIIAFNITHKYLQSGRKALPTMLIFHKILYLTDLRVKAWEESQGDLTTEETSQGFISLDHCFRCFSNAAMVYLGELMQDVTYFMRFNALCSIFKWWCQASRLYSHELEVSSLFLMQLVTAIEEMINGNKLCLIDDQNEKNLTNKGKSPKNPSGMNGEVVSSEISGEFHQSRKANITTDILDNEVANEVDNLQIGQLKLTNGNESQLGNGSHESHLQNYSDISKESKLNISVTRNKSVLNNNITRTNFKKQIEDISIVLLKFVPASNLSSSVASKLKKLHEIS
ncbi:uncharacterized protein [Palaemon carinicauda]|uniref:uncharacterized protein isoform X2 n=1 Tax=Palaemon carinicauda TaxID=392227 RepID=UPI0035B6A9F2